jgi:type 1 glutamine amidotransferase
MRALAFRFAVLAVASFAATASAADPLKLLIIDGQNNHDWKKTTPVLKSFLEKSGRFTVDVATSPPGKAEGNAWDAFRPDFSKYQVVLSNYNGELWPKPVQKALEDYVGSGGGLVIVHAANNAFPQWPEFNRMIGLGWRDAGFGDRVTVDDNGGVVRTDKGKGPGAGHGSQHEFSVVTRDRQHPVMMGLPVEWMHTKDELYHGQRGPAADMHLLATAYSAKGTGGTDAHEPMVWWIPNGKGKVFTTVMGHGDYSMKCVGFQTIVARGCEWVATDKVTLPIPKSFPTADKVSSEE